MDNEQAIMEARIPNFDNEGKVTYLSYRAIGFNVKESCHLAEVEEAIVKAWRKEDPEFKRFETDHLKDLQKTAAKDLLELEFRRNVLMFMRKDARIIQTSMNTYIDPGTNKPIDGMELLTDREFEYFKAIRKHYTPDQLLQLNKALEPEKHHDNQIVVLTWEGRPAALPEANDFEGFHIEVTDGDS